MHLHTIPHPLLEKTNYALELTISPCEDYWTAMDDMSFSKLEKNMMDSQR